MKKITNAIVLSHITKEYVLHHEKPTLVEKLVRNKTERFTALHDINLAIKKGERIGIIGPNGSGKTTLLKIIAGITTPTKGSVYTNGRTVSLIDLEAGFHLDLTGEQNIYIQGMLLGMRKDELKQKVNRIIRFADIGKFIDSPLFTYSEGMKLRLGFSIAVHMDPDILILDESLSTGDINFQKKTSEKLLQFYRMKKTIVIVSHWLEFIKKNSDKIIILNKGRLNVLIKQNWNSFI